MPNVDRMNVLIKSACCFIFFLLLSCNGDGNSTNDTPATDDRPALRILTWRYLQQDANLFGIFGARRGARMEVTTLPLGEIVNRARNKALAAYDIILVPTVEAAVKLREAGALQPFFVDSFTTGDVDDRFIDNEGYFAGLTRWTMATVYNPNAVTAEEAITYGNLAKLPLRNIRLGVAHPDSSGLAGIIAGIHTKVNPEAAALWTKVMSEGAAGGLNGNDTQQLDRMLAGELDAVFVSSGAASRWFMNGDPQHFAAAEAWRIRFPKTDNGTMNFQNFTCVTVGEKSPNRPLAMQFVDFLYEESTQTELSASWFEFPTQTFTKPNDYLMNIPDRIGRQLTAEQLDQNLPAAWSLLTPKQ